VKISVISVISGKEIFNHELTYIITN